MARDYFSAQKRDMIRSLFRQGKGLSAIAKLVGCSRGGVWRVLGPGRSYTKAVRHPRIDDSILLTVPKDTRDLTARLCGDPLPGRRAIDRMI